MSFEMNPALIKSLLKSEAVSRECQRIAEEGVVYAQSIAPVGTEPHDKNPGAYRDGIKAIEHTTDTRAEWRIQATDFKSAWIEYGAEHTRKQRVMGKTAQHLGGEEVA